jgi:DNA gyrase subunit A
VQESDEVSIISSGGIMLRLKVKDISASGRATRGFKLMDLGTEDKVAAIARINNAVVPIVNGENE